DADVPGAAPVRPVHLPLGDVDAPERPEPGRPARRQPEPVDAVVLVARRLAGVGADEAGADRPFSPGVEGGGELTEIRARPRAPFRRQSRRGPHLSRARALSPGYRTRLRDRVSRELARRALRARVETASSPALLSRPPPASISPTRPA